MQIVMMMSQKTKSCLCYSSRTPSTQILDIWEHFSTDFKSMFLFWKHPLFSRYFLTSILIPWSHISPNISEISFHHTTGICTQPLTCIPKYEKLSKDMWRKWFAVVFQGSMLRCFSCALDFTQSNNNQQHGIHIYSHIFSLKPQTGTLCFSNDLSRIQKFNKKSVTT